MRFNKIYLEISNYCNLSCAFCPGTKREKRRLTVEEFTAVAKKIRPFSKFLYFHIMGEPLCHPDLEKFLEIAGDERFKVIITTNGTLLPKLEKTLLSATALHKVNISLHAFEANDLSVSFTEYLDGCFSFGKESNGKKIVSYRLWNGGGQNEKNGDILARAEQFFPKPWGEERTGIRIANKTYIEHGDKFDWPDLSADEGSENVFCYGLRDQIGILCDGTVVPCCLDHEGDIALGNIFHEEMEDILNTPRAKAIYDGFSNRKAAEELCRKCGYARRFK